MYQDNNNEDIMKDSTIHGTPNNPVYPLDTDNIFLKKLGELFKLHRYVAKFIKTSQKVTEYSHVKDSKNASPSYDLEESLQGCHIQHGKSNDRIYVMDTGNSMDNTVLKKLNELAETRGYGKIIAKSPSREAKKFINDGFVSEAKIPGYFNGNDSCNFLAKYNNDQRKIVKDKDYILNVLSMLKNYNETFEGKLDERYSIRILNENDANDMAEIYKVVFKTYPFPIHDSSYLRKMMSDNVIYFGVFDKDRLTGISSCEMNIKKQNVEMTDFAVLPKYRGENLASHLLVAMEEKMKEMGIKTAYTIARSISFPMNITFVKAEYSYGGTLWNNTQIGGKIESMNILYKPL